MVILFGLLLLGPANAVEAAAHSGVGGREGKKELTAWRRGSLTSGVDESWMEHCPFHLRNTDMLRRTPSPGRFASVHSSVRTWLWQKAFHWCAYKMDSTTLQVSWSSCSGLLLSNMLYIPKKASIKIRKAAQFSNQPKKGEGALFTFCEGRLRKWTTILKLDQY